MANNNNNIGPRRLVVGAHYGIGDWLIQRITGLVLAIYTVILLVAFFGAHNFSYEGWAGLFSHQWFKLFTAATLLGIFYHVWVGVRDIFMDYVKNLGVRLVLMIFAVIWLIACAVWSVQILWSV
jgi:succinate dehydrogenase / fumarate reductase membrane anchor subunit